MGLYHSRCIVHALGRGYFKVRSRSYALCGQSEWHFLCPIQYLTLAPLRPAMATYLPEMVCQSPVATTRGRCHRGPRQRATGRHTQTPTYKGRGSRLARYTTPPPSCNSRYRHLLLPCLQSTHDLETSTSLAQSKHSMLSAAIASKPASHRVSLPSITTLNLNYENSRQNSFASCYCNECELDAPLSPLSDPTESEDEGEPMDVVSYEKCANILMVVRACTNSVVP